MDFSGDQVVHKSWRKVYLNRTNLACILLLIGLTAAIHAYSQYLAYLMSPGEKQLLSKTSVDESKVLFKDGKLTYNRAAESKVGAQKLTVSTTTNSTSPQGYRVTLATK